MQRTELRAVLRITQRAPYDAPPGVALVHPPDPGPPLRVGFRLPGAFLNDWTGVVYDETGFVMKSNLFLADGSNWDEPGLQKVKKLFGGNMQGCLKLRKNWYLCNFS